MWITKKYFFFKINVYKSCIILNKVFFFKKFYLIFTPKWYKFYSEGVPWKFGFSYNGSTFLHSQSCDCSWADLRFIQFSTNHCWRNLCVCCVLLIQGFIYSFILSFTHSFIYLYSFIHHCYITTGYRNCQYYSVLNIN